MMKRRFARSRAWNWLLDASASQFTESVFPSFAIGKFGSSGDIGMIKPDQTVGRKKKRSAGLSPYGARMFPGRQMFQSPEASRFAREVWRGARRLTDNGQDSPAHDYESEQRKRRQDEKSA